MAKKAKILSVSKDQLGRRIAEARNRLGITQKDLAGMTHGKISPTQLSNYEQGTREPGLMELVVLAQALRTTPGFLAGFTRLERALTDTEFDVVAALRLLPENERNEYTRRIKALSMIYQEPLPDERLNLPSPPDSPKAKSAKSN